MEDLTSTLQSLFSPTNLSATNVDLGLDIKPIDVLRIQYQWESLFQGKLEGFTTWRPTDTDLMPKEKDSKLL